MLYLRSEAQKRFSVFFLNTALAIAFGGLLATAIGKMDGLTGITAWRWIFIVEGSMTVIVGVVGYVSTLRKYTSLLMKKAVDYPRLSGGS
jgi:hypothetical protein